MSICLLFKRYIPIGSMREKIVCEYQTNEPFEYVPQEEPKPESFELLNSMYRLMPKISLREDVLILLPDKNKRKDCHRDKSLKGYYVIVYYFHFSVVSSLYCAIGT